jgi:regulator of sirC expression with transglutaminase-like and TPR domain
MDARSAFLTCLDAGPASLFEAALWIAAEHDPHLHPQHVIRDLGHLRQQVLAGLPDLPANELPQALLRRLAELGFQEDDDSPLKPRAALLHQVLQRRRGQPLSLALVAQEIGRQLSIPLAGVNFPGHFMLRAAGADHLLDPCSGRRLYTRDCRDLLTRALGPQAQLSAEHLQACGSRTMLQRLSRNLRHLHTLAGDHLAAVQDAERVLLLGEARAEDHLARAALYRHLDCPQAERYDLEHALMLSDDPAQRLQLVERLRQLQRVPATH